MGFEVDEAKPQILALPFSDPHNCGQVSLPLWGSSFLFFFKMETVVSTSLV